MGPISRAYLKIIRARFENLPPEPTMDQLCDLLHVTARWRSEVLAQTYIAKHGRTVMAGPFKGMSYASVPSEGALMPRFLGTYEAPVAPHLERLGSAGIERVVDIGCSDGYYAVGLARIWPNVTVHAYDTDPRAREGCAALAKENGVSERVLIGEEFRPEGFEAFRGQKTLVIVDIEGAEVALLNPAASPALADMHIIVETHDIFTPGALATLRQRFAPTHDVEQTYYGLRDAELPDWVEGLSHLDQLLSVWEWRLKATPWLVMTPKER